MFPAIRMRTQITREAGNNFITKRPPENILSEGCNYIPVIRTMI